MTTAKKTETKTAGKQGAAPQEAPPTQLPATVSLRLPYPRTAQEAFGISQSDWIVLTDVIFPNATSSPAVMLALRYCKARELDIMKKVVNIVPMYSKALGKMVDTIWPGIAEVRITATRTGDYAGRDAEVFGPTITKKFAKGEGKGEDEVEFPEWCQLTVYKIVHGLRCAFVGPKVFWEEAYATESRASKAPNEMWNDRRHGQLSKCSEAAALRAAFPEETGGQMTAEEMHGRVLDGDINPENMIVTEGVMIPPRPKESDFARQPEPKTAEQPKPATPEAAGPDGRPEPPPLGEPVQPQPEPAQEQSAEAEPDAEPNPEPEPEEETDQSPSEAWTGANNWLAAVERSIYDEKDLDDTKKRGRKAIEEQPGLTDDERDMLRGKFTTMILTEQQRRAKKAKR